MKRVLQRVYNKKMGLPIVANNVGRPESKSQNESRKGTPSGDVRETKRRRKE